MRIAYLSASVVPSDTASSVQVMKMTAAFATLSHDAALFCRLPPRDKVKVSYEDYGVAPDFRIVRSGWPNIRLLGGLVYGMRVKSVLANEAPVDLIYGRDIYSMLRCLKFNVPMVFEAHMMPQNRVHRMMERRLLSSDNVRRLICISHRLRERYLSLFPFLDPGSVIVAPSGGDHPCGKQAERAPLPGRPDAFQVGYVGQLHRGKGTEIIIPLAARLPEMDFHVIGGSEARITYWRQRSNSSNVYFHGFVPHRLIGWYLHAFDVVVAPAQAITMAYGERQDIGMWMSPLKIFEYMSHGKPIVASDLPVLREVLHHGANCLLCPPDSLEKWEAALRWLQASPEARQLLGEAARVDFIQKYSYDTRAARVISGLT